MLKLIYLENSVSHITAETVNVADSDSNANTDRRSEGENQIEDEDFLLAQIGHDKSEAEGEGHDCLVEHDSEKQADQGAKVIL